MDRHGSPSGGRNLFSNKNLDGTPDIAVRNLRKVLNFTLGSKPTPSSHHPKASSSFLSSSSSSSSFLQSNGDKSEEAREPIQVYLRIRPMAEKEKRERDQANCIKSIATSSVAMVAPQGSNYYKAKGSADSRFDFTHVFQSDSSQQEVFERIGLSLLIDAFEGKDATLMAYGNSGSGKTFTMEGTPQNPGILPRVLDCIFQSIEGQRTASLLRPSGYNEVKPYTQDEAEEAEGRFVFRRREESQPFLMKPTPSKGAPTSTSTPSRYTARDIPLLSREPQFDSQDATFVISSIDDNPVLDVDEDAEYSIWVSYCEVYKELIYDLLVEPPSQFEENKGKKRACLKIKSDKSKLFSSNDEVNHYVEGLTEVRVSNMEEAYLVLRKGQQNRKVFSTLLNLCSSRSHGIFTIKIIKLPVHNGEVIEDPSVIRATRFSILDLAGSERYTRTQNTGERLQEAGNINKSLMTLGKCMATLRKNQQAKSQKKQEQIPFRDSKLTFLFQKVFLGQARAAMVVNVNPCASNFDETLHVMEFSAITKQVTSVKQVVSKIDTGLSNLTKRKAEPIPVEEEMDVDDEEMYNSEDEDADQEEEQDHQRHPHSQFSSEEDDETIEFLSEKIRRLTAQVRASKEREVEVRNELTEKFTKQYESLLAMYTSQLGRQTTLNDERVEKKFEILSRTPGKSKKSQDDLCSELSQELEHLEIELAEAKRVIAEDEKYAASLNKTIWELTESLDAERQEKGALVEKIQRLNDELTNQKFLEDQRVNDLVKKQREEYSAKFQEANSERNIVELKARYEAKIEELRSQRDEMCQLNEDLNEENERLRHRVEMLEAFNADSPKKPVSAHNSPKKGLGILFHRSKDTDHNDASTNSPHLTKSSKVTTDLKNSNLPKNKGLNSKKSIPYIAENHDVQGDTKTTTLFKGVITPTATGGASAVFTETEELVHKPMGGYISQEEEIAAPKPRTRANSRQRKASSGSSRWGNENEAMDAANFSTLEPAQPTKRQPRQSARSKPY